MPIYKTITNIDPIYWSTSNGELQIHQQPHHPGWEDDQKPLQTAHEDHAKMYLENSNDVHVIVGQHMLMCVTPTFGASTAVYVAPGGTW